MKSIWAAVAGRAIQQLVSLTLADDEAKKPCGQSSVEWFTLPHLSHLDENQPWGQSPVAWSVLPHLSHLNANQPWGQSPVACSVLPHLSHLVEKRPICLGGQDLDPTESDQTPASRGHPSPVRGML